MHRCAQNSDCGLPRVTCRLPSFSYRTQGNPAALGLDRLYRNLDDIAELQHLLGGYLLPINQPIRLDADVDEDAFVDDVAHRAVQPHAWPQVVQR